MTEEIPKESKEMQQYFKDIENYVTRAYKISNEARKKGYDPEQEVDSPLARNMIERVEGLMSAVAKQLIGSGMAERMFELEKEYGVLDWRVSLVIAEEIAMEKFCKFKDKKEAMEVGIRAGFAYHTLGIVAAPLEGFIGLDIKKTRDGKEYFAINFSGPIRGAGGTGASVCVLIADYVRKKMGYAKYDPDEKEVSRYVTELNDYHERITNLQYHPSNKELEFLASNIPIEVTGDPSEKIDVSNFKDLPRIPTNKIRGGVCLVVSMIALKAPKLWKRLEKWGGDFDMDWDFIGEFIKIQKKVKAGKDSDKGNEDGTKKPKLAPNKTFISDCVAGRPVFTHPMAYGGFRLRYGRTRTTGYSASAIHPATMYLLNDFIAVGTQLKVERPGKAASMTVCDYIEGPIVRLNNGNVIRVRDIDTAKEIKNDVDKILFMGDILFNYGDFSENGHMLVPSGYCEEWWVMHFEKSIVRLFGSLDFDKVISLVSSTPEKIKRITKDPIKNIPSPEEALAISKKFEIPLHPYYTLFWKGMNKHDMIYLFDQLENMRKESDDKLVIDFNEEIKNIFDRIGLPHKIINHEFIIIDPDYTKMFLEVIDFDRSLDEKIKLITKSEENDPLKLINLISPIQIMDKAGTFIGARMGRPEKAKIRKMRGNPHGLFPFGEEGDRLKCLQSALKVGKVTSNFALYYCKHCKKQTIYPICEECNKRTEKKKYCKMCGMLDKEECDHDNIRTYTYQEIDIRKYLNSALRLIDANVYPDLIKGVKTTANKDHIPEHLVKAILRAKHEVHVNKDGSVRYDMTELPITHFKPVEIHTSIEKLKELGYKKDIYGKELVDENQIIELKPQDLIVPACRGGVEESSIEVLYKVGCFVDELLKTLYKQKPFYNFKKEDDVIGHLVIGLAPHISAGMVGRIIGYSYTAGCYAHPLWHAALRRDCDGDEASISLLVDSLLNFSRQFLPDRIGSRTMDAPLVLTAKLIPSEVDDMVHGMDVVSKYPLEFYEAACEYKYPWDVDIEQLGKRINTWKQYENIGFTCHTSNINDGVLCSAYKTLPSMKEKLDGQMQVAERISAVDTRQVAKLIIEKHFIKDIKGNLRKFSMQQFRCVKCNEKFRRPPLLGRCNKCQGKIIFTISEGSIIKYMGPAMNLATKYKLDEYLTQSLELTQQRIDEVFGKEKEIQEGLGKWC